MAALEFLVDFAKFQAVKGIAAARPAKPALDGLELGDTIRDPGRPIPGIPRRRSATVYTASAHGDSLLPPRFSPMLRELLTRVNKAEL